MRPDRLRDGAGVAQAVRVEGSDDEEVHGVGQEPHDGVPLMPHVVGHRLPGASHRLAAGDNQSSRQTKCLRRACEFAKQMSEFADGGQNETSCHT